MAQNQEIVDVNGKPWTWPDVKEVPKGYRRRTGEKKGKVVSRRCKFCLFSKIPLPQAPTIQDAKGILVDKQDNLTPLGKKLLGEETNFSLKKPCSVYYWENPGKGPVPEEYRCKYYVHHENKPVVKDIAKELTVGQLRSIKKLQPFIKILLNDTHKDTIKGAVEWILQQDQDLLDGLTKNLINHYVTIRKTKVNVEMKQWYNVTLSDGKTFKALAIANKKSAIEFIPPPEVGDRFSIAHELFEKCCSLVEREVVSEEVESEDD